jgi:hypothetical protein
MGHGSPGVRRNGLNFNQPDGPMITNRRVKVSGDLFHGRVPDGAVYVGLGMVGWSHKSENSFSQLWSTAAI